MKYKKGTVWLKAEVLKNKRIKNYNLLTMKCGYCGSIFDTRSASLSSAMRGGKRLSCGCMTSQWKSESASRRDDIDTGDWKLVKELDTEAMEQRRGIFICPECNHEHEIRFANTRITESCGCLKTVKTIARQTKPIIHKHPRLVRILRGMKSRCTNKNATGYKIYGGRGIFVTERWNNMENFINWSMKNGYSGDKELHRIDNDGGYEPTNCMWVTRSEHRKLHRKL